MSLCSTLHPAICSRSSPNVDAIVVVLELAPAPCSSSTDFRSKIITRTSPRELWDRSDSFSRAHLALNESPHRCCSSLYGSSFGILGSSIVAGLAQRLHLSLGCYHSKFGAAPVDSASKKLGRADWCSGSKRAIQASPRPNALLIQQRHTPGPCRGSV